MESDPDFSPTIVICPYITQGDDILYRDMQKAYNYFRSKGYNVSKAIDEEGSAIDVKYKLRPDIVFFTNPHNLTDKLFLITNYLDVLSIYVPYSHQVSRYENYQPQYNQQFHNLVWKIFTTNELDKKIFDEFSIRKGENVVVSGYPSTEYLINMNDKTHNVWKKQQKSKKKIIYAPHHTIAENGSLNYSTFLKYAHEMVHFSKKYKNEVQIAFKPHPLLQDKLADESVWGKQKTKDYYDFWSGQENTQLENGEYLDLFLQSDAIIHDSGSFLAEYLYVNKPSMYLFLDVEIELQYNPFGLKCLEVYDKAYSCKDIENFISHTVINESDKRHEQRTKFNMEYLINSRTPPSDFIVEDLRAELIPKSSSK
jgi:hypothetical protein